MSIPLASGDVVSDAGAAASLPPLPAYMVGRPFGADEAGRPITHVKGHIIRGAVEYMLECVVRRAAASLPPETGGAERETHLARARTAALEELVARLNAAIPDPLYHVTAEYLLDEAHSYSIEFDVFAGEICRQMSGDPDYAFNRGAKTIPTSLAYLGRPFSLAQNYRMVPRLVSKFAEVDMRSVRAGPGSAVIQYYPNRQLAELPEGLRPIYLLNGCRHGQGALAQLPRIVAGLPVAQVRETQCQLHGAPCCEWEFTWQEPRRRGLSRLWPWASQNDVLQEVAAESMPPRSEVRGLFGPAVEQAAARGSPEGVGGDELPAGRAGSTGVELPPLPAYIVGRPFGADEAGRPITHVKGPVVVGTVSYMLDCVAKRAAASLPPETSDAEREARIEQAREQALGQLVERLNAAIPDPLYHLTAEYLMDNHHSYSMEFMVFVDGICYEMSRDPHYFFEAGARCFPPSLTYLVRPFSVTQGYHLVLRMMALLQDSDVRVVHVEPGAAVIQWHAGKDTSHVPDSLRQRVLFGTCQGLQGAMAQIPRIVAGLPPARVQELRCVLRGDACCEWEFTWQEPRRRGLSRLWPWASQNDVLQEVAAEPMPPRSDVPGPFGPAVEQPAPTGSPEGVRGDELPAGRAGSTGVELPPLPAYMVGHPFGADEAGRPITQVKGHIIRGAVEYMLECVVRRAAASLPPETGGAERETHLAGARTAALEELVARLNAAIPDPLYHVTAEYLLDEAHSYSIEFDIFACEICRQMSGDPDYYFHRGAKTIPASLAYLGRPFSLAQVYRMVPRLVSKFAEADLRSAGTGPGSAVIQYYPNRQLAELPGGLRPIFLSMACRHAQGVLAQLPRIVAGLPVAEIRETQCQLWGDPCCEWEFTWQEPRRRGLGRLLPRRPTDRKAPGEPLPEPAGKAAPSLAGVPGFASLTTGVAAHAGDSPPPPKGEEELPPLPVHMEGRPFGADKQGRPIRQANGASILGVIAQMQDWAGQQAEQRLPAGAGAAERQAAIAQARQAALDQLVERLNAAIPDRTSHVTREYLLNPDHSYSHEFNLYANEFGREICGDRDFYYHRGLRSIPASLIPIARPLSLAQVYRLLPGLVAKVTQTDVRTVLTSADSAVLQWHPGRQFEEIPGAIHRHFMRMACRAYQGAYAAIPRVHSNLPPARVRELHCLLHGDPYCEWEFTWEVVKPRAGVGLWASGLASLLLLGALVLRLVPLSWLAGLALLLPVTIGLMAWQLQRVGHDRNQQRRLLLDQRESAEKQYDELQKASADLQLSNAALQHRLAELSALHEIGLVAASTLDLDRLLDDSLRAVTRRLGFDRALVLLVDEERRLLADGHSVGGTPEVAVAARDMVVSLDNESSFLSQAVRLGRPVLAADPTQVADEQTLGYVQALKTRRFVAVPLLVQGTALGVLAVDNATTDRPVTEESFDLLMTVGSQIAGAVDRVRLYQTLEQRIEQRTAELAQATREAQREKQYSEALIRNSPVAIVATDPAANVVTWNPAAEQLFGYTQPQALGRNLDALVTTPDLLQEAIGLTEKSRRGGRGHIVTQRLRRDDTLVDVEVLAVPVDVDDRDAGLIAIYHDLGELKRAEQALQESQRQLADIIDFMPDAVLVIDREGKVIAWNRAIEEMTGVNAEEMLGKGDYEYALPFYGKRRPILIDLVTVPQKELEEKYAQIRREGGVLMGETYVPRLKGGEAYLLGTASALRDSRGQIVGAIEVIRDFTERKQMEEALQQAKEVAEAATQAKSSFLATMSHEIRTPMNAIIGMSGLLMDTPLNADQRDFAETIRNSGDALLTIINDILDFSKMEAGKMDLEQQPFDLRECVESALDLMKLKASEKGLELANEFAGDVPPAISGDVTRLRQVLVNLLSNAVKFTEQGEVVVTVARDTETGREGDREMVSESPRLPISVSLHFTVRDTGIGIPPDRLNRLFQAFSQVDASTTRKYGGTGLGLAVSKRLSELMGGTMWVESEGLPGKGSAFHFTIRAPEAAEAQARPALQGQAPELRGRNVLIVDDNATNRRCLSLQVQGWGMQPRATGSPQEALEWVRQGARFDLAVLDLHMPEMDGVELAEALRAVGAVGAGLVPAPTALILLSSLGGYGQEIPADLFAACLTKPIRASALFDALMGVFAGQGAAVPATAPTRPDVEMAQRLPLRILIAEDNVVNQKLALRLLVQMGYRADVAANGLEAIQALERQPYDVVLMDVQMPDMDGLEATRQICARWPVGERPGRPRPRIIAMTASAMQGDREMCLAAGMDDYVSKPIRVDELVQALARCQPLTSGPAPA
jgi:PAS domain S-box-containing protein